MHVLSGDVKIMISCAAVLLFELAEAGRALRVISAAAELLSELEELSESLAARGKPSTMVTARKASRDENQSAWQTAQ